jgi:transposase-like protein
MGRRSVRDEMQKLVTRYKRSGKSRTEFGEEHGISVSKLSYWVNYFNKEAKTGSVETGGFVHLRETSRSRGICIRFPNGIEIESEEMPWEMLERLLRYVGE